MVCLRPSKDSASNRTNTTRGSVVHSMAQSGLVGQSHEYHILVISKSSGYIHY
jgi:hypothetical protein